VNCMDIISFGKAMAAKKAIKSLNDRLGDGVQDVYKDVKTRLEEIEKQDPHITLFNRVSDVEANINVNLNKHNLHVNSILNKSRFGLTDLIFDDFEDDSGIDASLSHGYAYDATNKLFTIASGSTIAEIVTIAENVATTPHMMTVSQAFKKPEEPNLYVSRDDGVTWKQVASDTLISLDDLPKGNKIRVKAVLQNGQELHGLSYSWI